MLTRQLFLFGFRCSSYSLMVCFIGQEFENQSADDYPYTHSLKLQAYLSIRNSVVLKQFPPSCEISNWCFSFSQSNLAQKCMIFSSKAKSGISLHCLLWIFGFFCFLYRQHTWIDYHWIWDIFYEDNNRIKSTNIFLILTVSFWATEKSNANFRILISRAFTWK